MESPDTAAFAVSRTGFWLFLRPFGGGRRGLDVWEGLEVAVACVVFDEAAAVAVWMPCGTAGVTLCVFAELAKAVVETMVDFECVEVAEGRDFGGGVGATRGGYEGRGAWRRTDECGYYCCVYKTSGFFRYQRCTFNPSKWLR